MPSHLIHIGFPKCGSTSLQQWFKAHPDLHFVNNGLAGFYTARELAQWAAETEAQPAWFVTSAEMLSIPHAAGKTHTPDYRRSAAERRGSVCTALRSIAGGEATVLIMTRGFRGTRTSSYSQYVRGGGTLGPYMVSSFSGPGGNNVEDHWDYDDTVAVYREAFGPERVIVLPLELLRDDPQAFTAILERRLGLEPSGLLPPKANVGLTGAQLYWYPRLSQLVEFAAARLGRFGPPLRSLYHARIDGPDLNRVLGVVERLMPNRTVDLGRSVGADAVELSRGRASTLAEIPEYAPYAADYLND